MNCYRERAYVGRKECLCKSSRKLPEYYHWWYITHLMGGKRSTPPHMYDSLYALVLYIQTVIWENGK